MAKPSGCASEDDAMPLNLADEMYNATIGDIAVRVQTLCLHYVSVGD